MRAIKLLVATLLVLAPAMAWAGTAPGSGIASSPHDFSSKAFAGGEICIACHTPHNADTTVADAPLWNHEVTAGPWTPYTSATLDATVGDPDGISKLCLSCHDGSVALDSFGGQTGSNFISGDELLGTDLTNDHPLSFTYNAALATTDGELFDPTVKTTALGGTIQADLLFSDQVECASCHDVHNSDAVDEHLLRITDAGSAICLTCHDK